MPPLVVAGRQETSNPILLEKLSVREVGMGTGNTQKCDLRNWLAWTLKSMTAASLVTSAMCVAMSCISKKVIKNQRHIHK